MTSSAAPLATAYSYHSSGRLSQAEALYRSVLAAEPQNSDAMQLLALLMVQTGRQDTAADLLRDAIAVNPDQAELHYNLARTLHETGQLDAAAAAYRHAVTLRPDFAHAYVNLADVLLQLGERHAAVESCERALALKPDLAEAHNNLGNALCESGELAQAAAAFERALALNPQFAAAHNNLGNVLLEQGFKLEAVARYERALALQPDYVDAYQNLGNALWDAGRIEKAAAAYRRALELDPDSALARAQLLHSKAHLCDWQDIEAEEEQVLALMRRHPSTVPPFNLLAQRSTLGDQLLCARQWSERLKKGRHARTDHHRPARHRKIRLGYLSVDFRDHPVAYAIAETIERHDRTRFDVFGYSFGPDDGSAFRRRFEGAFDCFSDLRTVGDDAAIETIHRDRIDILVDLTGYTQPTLPRLLATRPAPIQVNFLGFVGTSGADFIDYVIVDPFIVPMAQQPFFSERLVHLAGCWWPAEIDWEIAEETKARTAFGLPEDAFVFCCFNTPYKITARVFDIWMRLLQAVPNSVLWLTAANRTAANNLRREALIRGVCPERLVFARREPMADYLARHRLADLFLDTLPYNGVGTAYHALLAGLPVLTCAGDTFAGRIVGSMLRAVGLPELLTTTLEDYERLALDLTHSPDVLGGIRHKLARTRSSASLFNRDRAVLDSEAAFLRMYEIWCAGEPPRSFSLGSIE
jgi:predicted O-linked N-acetylglucosamine transferase (SPINDLY family)